MTAIRRGVPEDLDAIAAIQSHSPGGAGWEAGDYLAYDLRVCECEGRVAGFLLARAVAEDEREILDLVVAPQWRRQGLGRSLLGSFLQERAGAVYLEVRESNHAARSLYKSMGFQEVNRRVEYYNAPPETAIVMKFHSC